LEDYNPDAEEFSMSILRRPRAPRQLWTEAGQIEAARIILADPLKYPSAFMQEGARMRLARSSGKPKEIQPRGQMTLPFAA